MSRFFNFILALVMALALVPAPAAAQTSTYRIAGIVVDALTGQPLSLAEVTLSPVTALNEAQTFLTAVDGRFLFTNLAPGKYRLLAVRRGYTLQGFNAHEGYMTAIVAGPGQDSEHLRFRLSPSAVLTGTISDQWNDPVREAEVLLFHQSWSGGSFALHFSEKTGTDDLGRYRFSHLSPGTYAVAVVARPWWESVVSQSIVVSKSGAQTGTSGPANLIESLGSSTIAADTGVPAISNPALDVVYPVTYFPNVTSLAEAARLTLRPGAMETADVTLRPVPSLHLHVKVPAAATNQSSSPTDESDDENTDAPVTDSGPRVDLSLEIGGYGSNQIPTTTTEISPGLFELSGIPPGDISVMLIDSQGGSTSIRMRSLHLSASTELDLNSHGPLADVSGVVLMESDAANETVFGRSKFSSPVLTLRSSNTGESYTTSVSAKGEFSFAGSAIPSGIYEVGFGPYSPVQVMSLEATGATVSRHTVDLSSSSPIRLTVHAAQASCTITGFAIKEGKPIAGAMILLVPQDPDQNAAFFHRDQSDSDGSFTMAPIFPGRYTLLAIENGWELEWANPAVLFKYLPNGQPIELLRGAALNLNAKVQ
jgi:hypothetical protein